MKATKIILLFVIIVILSACKDSEPVSPIDFEEINEPLAKNNKQLSVMTRNIYIGTDVDMILQEEDPYLIPLRVAEAFQMLLGTNFPERAEALAEEILEKQPDLVGLQEVTTIRLQSPGDAVVGGNIPAEEVFLDYLKILMDAISAAGLNYQVVAKIQNADVEMPMIVSTDPNEFDDVRMTDYDVILARKGVAISDVEEVNYQARLIMPGTGLELPCGYVAVNAKIGGKKYRFVNTHLQDADQGDFLLPIQLAQAEELLTVLSGIKIPVILVGDFNSAAPNEATYKLITEVHTYMDSWLLGRSNKNINGFTYGHDPDLLNTEQNFWKRIDYIFIRNGKSSVKRVCINWVKAEVTGDELSDKTSSGLWPSDHGGVYAELKFKCSKKCKTAE